MNTVNDRPSHELVRAIGRFGLMALIVNSVIGAGIFELPSVVAKAVGGLAPWAYVAGAVMAATIVAVVVELSSQFKQAGGAYAYGLDAFGSFVGAQVGWFSLLARVSTAAAIANVLGSYTDAFLFLNSNATYRFLLITAFIAGLALVNLQGVKRGAVVSIILSVLKVLPLVGLIVLGAFHLYKTGVSTPLAPADYRLANWGDALLVMVFAYSGFESAMIPGSEMRDPRRDAPVAAFSALAFVTVLYLLVHIVVMNLVPDLATSTRPLSDAAAVLGGAMGGNAMSLAVIVSACGWLSAAAVTTPRLTYAMASNGHLPKIMGDIHATYRTPWIAIILWAAIVLGLTACGDFVWNVTLSVAARLVVYSSLCAAALKLRAKCPGLDAWRFPFGLLIPIAGIASCGLLATRLHTDHVIAFAGVGTVAAASWWLGKRGTPGPLEANPD